MSVPMVTETAAPRATTRRVSLLDTARNPANWRRREDCRPALRTAILSQLPPGRARLWALWLADRFTAAGDLAPGLDRRALIARSGISPATFCRYATILERLGLIERRYEGRIARRSGEYRHVLVLAAGPAFRPPPEQRKYQPCENPRTHKGDTPVLSVGQVPTVTRGRAGRPPDGLEDLEETRERAALIADWPRLARSRTDLPSGRPGYENNITHRRWMIARMIADGEL